jgi:DNA polymerase-1
LLAHVSGDPTLVEAIKNGEDIHALTAQACFDHIPNDISLKEVKKRFPKERKDSKPINFGVIYGMGPQALAAALGITEDEAEVIINDRYMSRYPGVKAYIERMHAIAKKEGLVRTAIGRPRHLPAAQLPPTDKNNKRLISKACRQGQNAPIQGFAADFIELAMRDIRRFFRKTTLNDVVLASKHLHPYKGIWTVAVSESLYRNFMRPLLQVHDELIMEMHPAVANFCRDEVVRMMETALTLKVPVTVDAALGTNWYETKE